jgi:hypothetical protein
MNVPFKLEFKIVPPWPNAVQICWIAALLRATGNVFWSDHWLARFFEVEDCFCYDGLPS